MDVMPIYHITFHTYGTWLTGDERGSVKVPQNRPTQPKLDHQPHLVAHIQNQMRQQPVQLGSALRASVEASIVGVCAYRKWMLHAINVRQNHVHAVVSAPCGADKIRDDFKAYATRHLRQKQLVEQGETIWAEGGSGRIVTSLAELESVIEYVRFGQGPDLHDWP